MATITLETVIAAPRERVFDLARSIDAHQDTAAEKLFLAAYMRRFLVERNAILKRTAESNAWRKYLPSA